MKRLCKSSDKSVVELSEDIISEILHRLPSKSLARFQCVGKHWRKCIDDPSSVYSCRSHRWSPHPYMIGFFCQDRNPTKECTKKHFFFSSRISSEVIDCSLEESDNFLGMGVYIIASSNGFILIADDLRFQRAYCVYNPATRQSFSIHVTIVSCINVAAIGFHCKADEPEKDVISFTIVLYGIWFDLRSSVTIESFSSETNAWTTINLPLDIPLRVSFLSWQKLGSVGIIDGMFCWIDMDSHIILYDSVNRRFLALQLSNEIVDGDARALGVLGRALYYALCIEAEIIVWCLESNIRSQDVVWVRKYAADITSTVLDCPEAFGHFLSYRNDDHEYSS